MCFDGMCNTGARRSGYGKSNKKWPPDNRRPRISQCKLAELSVSMELNVYCQG